MASWGTTNSNADRIAPIWPWPLPAADRGQARTRPGAALAEPEYDLYRRATVHRGLVGGLVLPLKEARIYRLFSIGVTLVMSLLAIGFYILLNAQEVYAVRLGVLMLQLRDQAHTDPLTRLANRGWFQESFSRELKKATRLNQNLALIMFDIDHFKKINDRFGHQAGDRALVKLAETARLAMRDYDLISRWGGEEFVALLPDTDLETARLIAERLREQIAATDLPEIGQVTCSFGVVERRNNENGDSLINRADAALYQAKDAGRNRVICA